MAESEPHERIMMMKWNKATKKQQAAARSFSEKYGITASQCMKYLDECFQLYNGEITAEEFEKKTGNSPKIEK